MSEERPRAAAHLAQTLVDESPDALIALSPSGDVLFWSRGAERVFGYPRDEAMGRAIVDLTVPAERVDEARKALATTLQSGSCAYESLRRSREGALMLVEITQRLVRDAEDRVEFQGGSVGVRSTEATRAR